MGHSFAYVAGRHAYVLCRCLCAKRLTGTVSRRFICVRHKDIIYTYTTYTGIHLHHHCERASERYNTFATVHSHSGRMLSAEEKKLIQKSVKSIDADTHSCAGQRIGISFAHRDAFEGHFACVCVSNAAHGSRHCMACPNHTSSVRGALLPQPQPPVRPRRR